MTPIKKTILIAFLITTSLLTCVMIKDVLSSQQGSSTIPEHVRAQIRTVKFDDQARAKQAKQASETKSRTPARFGNLPRYDLTAKQRPDSQRLPIAAPIAGLQPMARPSASELVAGLTEEDIDTLSQLPPMCTSELPGIDLSGVESVREALLRQQQDEQRAEKPSGKFVWPEMIPSENHPQQLQQSRVAQAGYNEGAQFSNRSAPHQVQQASASFEVPADGRYPLQRVAKNPSASALPNPHASASPSKSPKSDEKTKDDKDPHLDIYSRDAFPSAKECATCHEQIYEEWSTSSHAYASVSPMFHKFENTINRLAQGTLGYFCLRCHAPVATTMGLRRDQAIWDGPRVFKEGVTCVACHRVKTPYTKADGERRIEPGDIYAPVYGSADGASVEIANKYSSFFKTKTNRNEKGPGLPIHKRAIQFEELSESSFCMSCHQVAVKPGIKLEVVWDQYRASPACKDGISCQDCHMGKIPGVDGGYSFGPAAVVNGKVLNPERKHSNHMFYGPGYSIAHPGTFPDNLEADRWKFNEWLEFDWRAGWGTDKFEDALADGEFYSDFPAAWKEADDRYDAREIIDENLKKLDYKKDLRRQVLENGSKLDGPYFTGDPTVGKPLQLRYCLTNTNPGHNMPSGSLGAQPQIWMNIALRAPNGQLIWESGHLDSNGDLCDNHSLDVVARRIPMDTQLMNLQTKFLTTNVKGTDREMYLPVNFDFDQLPFLRPAQVPITVLNHPPFIRMEGHSIPALGSRNVKYSIPSRLITQPGTYQLSVRLRSRAEPIYFMRFCDSTPEMERMMNEYIADFHSSTVIFEVH